MQTILIFGGTGSLGKTLIRRYIATHKVFVFSRDEAKHWTISCEYVSHPHRQNLKFIVGDIRDPRRVEEALRVAQPTSVIVAAALKQVDTCELSPNESVMTNLLGTLNVIDAVTRYNHTAQSPVDKCLFVSTDKACAPVNVYGMCKAISERLFTSMISTDSPTKFVGVRYGNVLESRGSIIPLFKYQVKHADVITVTDPEMTRFVMTLDDSVSLIEKALQRGEGGTFLIPRLRSMKISDLAEIFSEKYNKPVKVIGQRPGEKLHEELLNPSERIVCVDEQTYMIIPSFTQQRDDEKRMSYTSNDSLMSKTALHDYLAELNIFDAPLDAFVGRTIDEIVKGSSK